MPITLNCPKCKKPFRIRDESVGRKVRCPACAAALLVPGAVSQSAMALLDVGGSRAGGSQAGSSRAPGASRAGGGRAGESRAPESRAAESRAPESRASQSRAAGSRAGALSATAAKAPTARVEPVKPPIQEEPVDDAGQPGSYADLGLEGPTDDPFTAAAPSQGGSATAATQPVSKQQAAGDSQTAVSRRGAATGPLRPVGQRGVAKSRVRPGLTAPSAEEVADLSAGLKLVHVAIFLLLVPFVAMAAQGLYLMLSPLTDTQEAGMLGVQGLTLWQEIELAYTVLPLLGFFGLALAGRLKCMKVPEVTQSRGMAAATVGFTSAGLLCLLLYTIGTVLGPDAEGNPSHVHRTAYLAGVVVTILAEVWFCLFLAQIGWPMGSPRMTREVAWFFSVVILVPLALLVINQYYKLFGMEDVEAMRREIGPKYNLDQVEARKVERILMGSSALLVAAILIVFRYAAVVHVARNAVNRFRQAEMV